jgi:catechol-2,3-dioxygenase
VPSISTSSISRARSRGTSARSGSASTSTGRRSRSSATARTPVLLLHEDRDARPAGRAAGPTNCALLYPSREELARAVLRLNATQTPIQGASHHETHEAIYLADADGNGIELAADRPRETWPEHLGYAARPSRWTSRP